MSDPLITVDQVRRTRLLGLADSATRNALSPGMVAAIRAAVDDAEDDHSVRVIVLRGAGEAPHFSVGGDIRAMDDGVAGGYRYVSDVIGLFRRLEHVTKPVIAAVDGYALGGGLELALACDLIFCAEEAVFGLPEANLGAVPGYAIARLPELVGRSRAKELMFSARRFGAAEALSYGLVVSVHARDDILNAAVEMADRIAAIPRLTADVIKRSTNGEIADRTLAETTASAALFWGTPELQEGVRAFRERRPPNFNS